MSAMTRLFSQQALGAGQNIVETLVARDRETQRPRKRLEQRFDLVMRRTAVETAQMNVGACGLRETLKKIL